MLLILQIPYSSHNYMDYKEAIKILLDIIQKYPLSEKEKEALRIAMGTLDCGVLVGNRQNMIIKNKKAKQERDKQD